MKFSIKTVSEKQEKLEVFVIHDGTGFASSFGVNSEEIRRLNINSMSSFIETLNNHTEALISGKITRIEVERVEKK